MQKSKSGNGTRCGLDCCRPSCFWDLPIWPAMAHQSWLFTPRGGQQKGLKYREDDGDDDNDYDDDDGQCMSISALRVTPLAVNYAINVLPATKKQMRQMSRVSYTLLPHISRRGFDKTDPNADGRCKCCRSIVGCAKKYNIAKKKETKRRNS